MGTERATNVRLVVVLLTTLVAVMLYLDRICLSFAERAVKSDLGLSNAEMGWLLSAFFWAYAIAQVPAGWLSDRYGVRLTLALYLALWSSFTAWMGLAAGLVVLILLRLGCGLTEAGAYPAAASLLSVWVPPTWRGLASGIVSVGGRLGGFFAPVLTGTLMVAFTADAPSLLQPQDLLDPPELCRLLNRAGPDPAARLGREIVSRMPPDAAAVVKEAVAPGDRLDARQVQTLVSGLNHVLRDRSLTAGLDPDDLKLSGEALRLTDRPAGELSEAQLERRNRLVLEAAFPAVLREVHGPGWRPAMLCYGAVGLVIALLFWWFVRNRPRQHPACNAAEVALIEAGRPGGGWALKPLGAPPWRGLLLSVSLWLVSLVSFFTNVGWVFLLTWFPRYLQEEHHVPVETRMWMVGLPLLVGIFGMLLGGLLTDVLKSAYGAWWGRSAFLALSRFVVMGAFLACVWLRTPWAATAALAVVAWATDLGTPAIWAYCQDVGGRQVGSVLGWGNMWGNLGGAVSPLVLGWVIDNEGWDYMFLTCAGAFLLAGVGSLFINASRPVVPEDA